MKKRKPDIARLCGCPDWEYPNQVVRDVEELVKKVYLLGAFRQA